MKKVWLIPITGFVIFLGACSGNTAGTPTISPATPPPEASATFQKILADCWGVADMKEIDASKPTHVAAFDCARERLLKLAADYPNFAEAHRVLGWGYYYKNQDGAAARAEYQRAADIYQAQGKTVEEADMLRRLGLLYMSPNDTSRGCQLLLQALRLDPKNAQAQQAAASFFCLGTATPGVSVPNATLRAVTPAPLPNPPPQTTQQP